MSDAQSWTHYWQQGHTESCIDNEAPNDNELSKYWQGIAKKINLPSKVVDLATGNGSVIKQLYRHQPTAAYTGVDYANIMPAWASDISNIEFIGNTDIASLPFANRNIDLVTSQFGVEYALNDKTVSEVARVLNDKGQLAFIMHHTDSDVVQPARLRLLELTNILKSSQIIETTKGFIENRLALDALERAGELYLNNKQAPFSPSISGQCFQIVNQVIELVEKNDNTSASQLLKRLETSLIEEEKRLTQLVNAAKNEKEINELVEKFSVVKISSSYEILETSKGNIIGWLVTGMKRE